jgi:ABC-type Fe3+-hydroxamate transport system substrate-binding protein
LRDHLGRDVPLVGAPRRLVSLVPSITESVVALGGTLVGRTEWCPEVPGAIACGGTKNPALEAIFALAPDLVLAAQEENREKDVLALASRVPVFVTDVRTVAGALAWVEELKAILAGGPFPPLTLSEPPPRRLTLSEPARREAPRGGVEGRPAIALCWKQPLTGIGEDTYAGDVLRTLGLKNVLSDPKGRYPRLSLEELASLKPVLVLLPSEPYPWTAPEGEELERELASRGAVARCLCVSGEALTWWGTRTERALEELREALRR